jgi:hypothetical protein
VESPVYIPRWKALEFDGQRALEASRRRTWKEDSPVFE